MWEWASLLENAGLMAATIGSALLCLVGIVLSALSISGSWLVALATIIMALVRPDAFPGIWTISGFILLCAAVEVLEMLAGSWGVRKRGGSKLAGALAFVGGITGLLLGALIPVPIAGPLIGMFILSFVFVYLAERHRLKKDREAAHIAVGAVMARVVVIFLKVIVTMGMTAILFIGML